MTAYDLAKERFSSEGIDTELAMEKLAQVPVSVHCWQGDDVIGFDGGGDLSGGIQTTGNYPGRARNFEELKKDIKTAFSLMRCFIYGFFPNVVILYLVYYNFFALVFGLLGWVIVKMPVYAKIIILTIAATMITACFTLLDDLITPWMLGYTEKSARVYFYASLPVLGIQCACAAVTVALLWYPLSKVFSVVSFANHKSKKTQLEQDFSVISSDNVVSEQNITVLQQERQLHSDKEQSIIDTKFVGGK